MDLARQSSGVDQILDGDADLPRAYTGKGVVAAIFDQGVDPNHINFFDADKNNRIDYLAYQTYNATGTGIAQNFYGPGVKDAPPVSDFVTDNDNAYHGTHTLGILAGSYRGEMALPQGTDASGKPVLEINLTHIMVWRRMPPWRSHVENWLMHSLALGLLIWMVMPTTISMRQPSIVSL